MRGHNRKRYISRSTKDDTDRLAGWVGSMCERITSQHGKPIKSPFGLLHHQLSEPGDWSPTPTGSETNSVLWRMPNGSLHDPVFFIDNVKLENYPGATITDHPDTPSKDDVDPESIQDWLTSQSGVPGHVAFERCVKRFGTEAALAVSDEQVTAAGIIGLHLWNDSRSVC